MNQMMIDGQKNVSGLADGFEATGILCIKVTYSFINMSNIFYHFNLNTFYLVDSKLVTKDVTLKV